MTTARALSSAATRSRAACSASSMASDSELNAVGRFSVSVTTPRESLSNSTKAGSFMSVSLSFDGG
jgi:hypothetical protein